MVTTLNSVTTAQRAPPDFLFGRVVLVPKPTGDLRSPSACRPIILLNLLYSTLLQTVDCYSCETSWQSSWTADVSISDYSLPGRSIHTYLLIVRDILVYAQAKSISRYIVSLDQANAFDRVEQYL